MRILVLGGTGWVGHHIALACARFAHDVTVCSRGRKSDYVDELGVEFRMITADKSDANDMRRVLADPYEVIIDSVPTEKSIELVFAQARGLTHYVHCSSTGGYAPLPAIPGDETMPYDEFEGGWRQKQVVDAKALDLHVREGFPATVLRPSYITGPGLLPLDNVGGRREDFLSDILAETTLDLPNDGQALLHPVHVRDLVEAFALAAREPRSIGQIYNVCLEKAVTLTRYLQITAESLGRVAHITYVPLEEMLAKHGDRIETRGLRFLATHMCYDISKAKAQLGYRPSLSTEQAIAETARWAAPV